jgi:hypothetical protein
MNLNIFYRVSDMNRMTGRLDYITNYNCLENFIHEFPVENITMIADNVKEETYEWLKTYKFKEIHRTSLGNSRSFWFIYKLAMSLPKEEYVYFIENDYIHKVNSMKVLFEGLKLADYVTLYDHPDKYFDGINPKVHNGGEKTKVFLTNSTHWKLTNSTTMTFATRVNLLKRDSFIFKFFTIGILKTRIKIFRHVQERSIPADYRIFSFLIGFKRRKLICPIPGYSTHGEGEFLAPLQDWERFALPVEFNSNCNK